MNNDLFVGGHSSLFIAEATAPSPMAGKYFLCCERWNNIPYRKRWDIYSEEVLKSHGLDLGKLEKLNYDQERLDQYHYQGLLPIGSCNTAYFRESNDPVLFRLWLGSFLQGQGIEFGPGANPFPASFNSCSLYADRFSLTSLSDHAYPGQNISDFVSPHLLADMSDMRALGDSSFDFVIASHVIEHVSNPINAIVQSHRILKNGGHLLLVIPSKERTFDKDRPLTPLAHIVDDYTSYDRDHDLEHYKEWFTLVHQQGQGVEALARDAWSRSMDIHYHVWNPGTFEEVVDYVQTRCVPYSEYRVMPETSKSSIEFYAMLTK